MKIVPCITALFFSSSYSYRLAGEISGLKRRSVASNYRSKLGSGSKLAASTGPVPEETDVVVIGSGLAGLSCAALLAHVGYDVTVLESHDHPGGCAHSWTRNGYHFESGPSLYTGFSIDKSPNPLKNIFQIIGEEPEWLTYDRWGNVLPEGTWAAKIGPEEMITILEKYGGEEALRDWKKLIDYMMKENGLANAAQATPSLALREDASAVFTLMKYFRRLLITFPKGVELNESFSVTRDRLGIKSPFVLHWLDMLCFLLQGLPAEGTLNAVIAYMLADWYRPGVTLDYPKGGSGAIVDALVRGVEKHSGKGRVFLRKHVTGVITNNGQAEGVTYRDDITKLTGTIRAKRAVVSNIDAYQNRQLIPLGASPEYDTILGKQLSEIPKLNSFIHLHAGIDATGLPESPNPNFPTQWAVVRDWEAKNGGIEAPRNIVLVSLPSLIDKSLAPEGKYVLHAYTPATEPYEWWKGLDRRSEEYLKKKEEAADFLWKAVETYIPDARLRSDKKVEQIGTPLTHERFLRRSYGTYGPRVVAGKQTLPGHKTPLKNFWTCGDFSFPGIGVPATASSGAITANSIMTLQQHFSILDKLQLPDI